MTIKTFRVIIEKDQPKGYHVWCPDLPGCHSEGDTIAEARENIAEAIQAYIESLIARNKPIPSAKHERIFIEHLALPIRSKALVPA